MRRPKVLMIAVAVLLAGGAAATVAVSAGASGTNVTYFACLESGKLASVGTVAPTCNAPATQISWNSQGSRGVPGPTGPAGATGPTGPQGLSSDQYVGENAWSESLSVDDATTNFPVSTIPTGRTLVITGFSQTNVSSSCELQGAFHGGSVFYDFGDNGLSDNSGLQLPLDSSAGATITCPGSSSVVTVTGYLT